eukprot:gene9201-35450_t
MFSQSLKLARTVAPVVQQSGQVRHFNRLLRAGKTHTGKLVGEDSMGNKYYVNDDAVYGAHRFVDYNDENYTPWDDPAQTSPEWHAWFHKMTDDPPTASKDKFAMEWQGNLTATSKQYVPYSTVKPKMHAWSPDAN